MTPQKKAAILRQTKKVEKAYLAFKKLSDELDNLIAPVAQRAYKSTNVKTLETLVELTKSLPANQEYIALRHGLEITKAEKAKKVQVTA